MSVAFILFVWSLMTQDSQAKTVFSDDLSSCQMIGDSDVYGIGIRIGLYLQWLATLVATILEPRQTRAARISSNIIILAMFINTFHGISHESIVAVEWYIVIWLSFFLNVANIPPNLLRLQESTGSFATMLLLWLCIIATQPWLYFFGIENGSRLGCKVRIFFFGSISVYGKWRTFGKVASVISCVSSLGALATAINVLIAGFFQDQTTGDPDDPDDRKTGSWILGLLQFMTGIISILQVEMTIRINKIELQSSLLDSGQLIPTLVGCFVFGAVAFSVCRGKLRAFSAP